MAAIMNRLSTILKKQGAPLLLLLIVLSISICQAEVSSFTTFTSGDVEEKVKVHYVDSIQGDEVIVFIHGWSCDATFWNRQADHFNRKYRTILVDLPGHGMSSKSAMRYDFDLFAESVRAVLDAVGVRKAVVVGHSMGFPVARRFIQKYPERARALCIVDGAYFRLPEHAEIREWEKRNREFAQMFTGENRDAFLADFLESLFVEQSPVLLKNKVIARMTAAPPHVANSAMEEMVKTEHWYPFSLDIPTLAVYVVSSDLPPDNERYLRSQFPQLEYHLWDGVGHFLMMEKPEQFNKVLESFLVKL